MRSINIMEENGLLTNELFRKTLHTSKYLEVSVLYLKPDMEITLRTHASMDQYFGFNGGKGKCFIEGQEYSVETGDVILIPAGSENEVTKFPCHNKD